MNKRLGEQGGATTAQIEVNRKRDSKLAKLQKHREALKQEHEQVQGDLRMKAKLSLRKERVH